MPVSGKKGSGPLIRGSPWEIKISRRERRKYPAKNRHSERISLRMEKREDISLLAKIL